MSTWDYFASAGVVDSEEEACAALRSASSDGGSGSWILDVGAMELVRWAGVEHLSRVNAINM